MVIGFLGDSITEGVGASSVEANYVSNVEKMLHVDVKNYGISGTRIARQKALSYPHAWDMDFNLRTSFIADNLDYIFVFGGTNDFGHGDAPIGSKEDKTVYTYCGAINVLIDTLLTKVKKEHLIFITSLNRWDENNLNPNTKKSLKDYVEVQKAVLEYRNIKYIDFFNKLFETPTTIENVGYFSDGLHPNDLGHKIIAKKIVEYIKNFK